MIRPADVIVAIGAFVTPYPPRAAVFSGYQRGMTRILQDVKRAGGRATVLEDVPFAQESSAECLLARRPTFGTCTFAPPRGLLRVGEDLQSLAGHAAVRYVATHQWFCLDNRCPLVVGRTIVYRDNNHLSALYALELSASLGSALGPGL